MKNSTAKKTIYDISLHQELGVEYYTVIRVAGGWIYRFPQGECQFVPYDNEFIDYWQ